MAWYDEAVFYHIYPLGLTGAPMHNDYGAPQTIKIILPPMVNQMVNLIKNTSCLYIVGGADLISLTYSFVTGASTGGAYAPAYVLCGALFFVICFPLSHLATRWETMLKRRESQTLRPGKEAA